MTELPQLSRSLPALAARGRLARPLGGLLGLGLAAAAHGQVLLAEAVSPADGTQHGRAVSFHLPGGPAASPAVMIGAPAQRHFTGSAHIVPGGVRFHPWAPELIGSQDGEEFGAAVLGGLTLVGAPSTPGTGRVVGAPGFDADGPGGVTLPDAGRVVAYDAGGAVLWARAGDAGDQRLGSALAAMGDVDGDGIGEVLVGAPSTAGAGAVWLLSGSTGAVLRVHTGAGAGDRLGAAVVGLEDLDGDHVPDYGAGAPFAAGGRGEVVLLSGATGQAIATHVGPSVGGEFGASLASGADIDRDGVQDLAVGAPGSWLGRGTVQVLSLPSGASLLTLDGTLQDGRLGASVALCRDFDGDGAGDVVAGAPSVYAAGQPTGAGRTTVFSGSSGAPLARLSGGWFRAGCGSAVASGADFDGDGLDDVVIGGYEDTDGYGQSGIVSVLGVGTDRRSTTARVGSERGLSVAAAGDLDGDGRSEILVGAIGEVRVEGHDGATLAVLPAPVPGDEVHVAALGDIDGDGLPDFVCSGGGATRAHSGAPGHPILWVATGTQGGFPGGMDAGGDVDGDGVRDVAVSLSGGCPALGGVDVLSGATGTLIRRHLEQGPQCEDYGACVAILDDLDGDGHAELAIGIPGRRLFVPPFDDGVVEIMSGADGSLLRTLRGQRIRFGTSLASLDDADGDGIGDVAVGWWDPDPFQTRGGVLAMSAASGAELWSERRTSPYEGIGFGYALAGLGGDMDGDGVEDLVVGFPGAPTRKGLSAGGALVLSGATGAELRRVDGVNGWDYLGYSVAGLGDVDGDGEADFVLGAPTEAGNPNGLPVGLDRVEVVRTNPLLSARECRSTPNASGGPAGIGARGGSSVTAADLVLEVQGAPAAQFGMVVFGTGGAVTPFFGGVNCVGPGWQRLTGAWPLDGAGAAEIPVDLGAPQSAGFAPGSSWAFQAWFRDPVAGAGTTDAVRIRFTP